MSCMVYCTSHCSVFCTGLVGHYFHFFIILENWWLWHFDFLFAQDFFVEIQFFWNNNVTLQVDDRRKGTTIADHASQTGLGCNGSNRQSFSRQDVVIGIGRAKGSVSTLLFWLSLPCRFDLFPNFLHSFCWLLSSRSWLDFPPQLCTTTKPKPSQNLSANVILCCGWTFSCEAKCVTVWNSWDKSPNSDLSNREAARFQTIHKGCVTAFFSVCS